MSRTLDSSLINREPAACEPVVGTPAPAPAPAPTQAVPGSRASMHGRLVETISEGSASASEPAMVKAPARVRCA